jgi:hypothetical protein
MGRIFSLALALSFSLVLPLATSGAATAKELKVISDQTVKGGLVFPESVACDRRGQALYSGQFGGTELKPAEKDGKGKISKLSMTGEVVEDKFAPEGNETMNKPKGIWIRGNRMWVADIDVVWVFDIKSRKGKKFAVPEMGYGNDVAVIKNALYISDNRNDRIYRVEPADFLNRKKDPKVTVVLSGKSVNPNGIYPANDGSLLVAGLKPPEDRAIYAMDGKGEVKELSKPLGALDGLYQMKDGTILSTDWKTGSLFSWTEKDGMKTLASGFKGPADFCAFPSGRNLTVIVPDLAKSELRIIQLSRN